MIKDFKRFIPFFFIVVFLTPLLSLLDRYADAQAGDVIPPKITDVEIVEVTDTSLVVSWQTDEDADSVINYGLDKNYGTVRDPLPNKKLHEILLDTLEPSTTYHFRVVSSDSAGNQSLSGDFTVTTKGVQDIENIERVASAEERALVEKAVASIQNISDEEALAVVSDVVQEIGQGITSELTILGDPEVRPETTTALVLWRTDRPANSIVSFSPENSYSPASSEPYIYSQGDSETQTTEHRVEIIGLEPSTRYHLQASSRGQFGIVGRSEDVTFTTKSILPNIFNLSLAKVEETSATFTWQTSVPSSALIEYENLDTGIMNSRGTPQFTADHLLRITDLELGALYSAVIIAENVGGDRVRSEPIQFITVKDEEPPIISKVTNESTLFPGAESRIQTIISWQTDEPSVCDLFYRQGLSPLVEERRVPRQDENFLERHVQVITSFTPSTVYQFWIACLDPSGNSAQSEDFVLFTPEREKSIIDIILENFEGAFGWVKDIRN